MYLFSDLAIKQQETVALKKKKKRKLFTTNHQGLQHLFMLSLHLKVAIIFLWSS